MQDNDKPLSIDTTFVVLRGDLSADTVPVTDTFWPDLDERYGDFAGNTLISSFRFDDDWPTWERHPKGDEFVCLMSGDVDMVLRTDRGEDVVHLSEPGSYVIVPRGTWHTARVHAPTTMLFMTPGEGTENRETPAE